MIISNRVSCWISTFEVDKEVGYWVFKFKVDKEVGSDEEFHPSEMFATHTRF